MTHHDTFERDQFATGCLLGIVGGAVIWGVLLWLIFGR